MKRENFKNNRQRILIIILPLIVLLCFSLWYLYSRYLYNEFDFHKILSENSVWDLSDFDFENGFVRTSGKVELIPDAILTPKEFEARRDEAQIGYASDNTVCTSKQYILLPDDSTYMIVGNSIDFSENIYINGELRQSVGDPGVSAESSTPGYAYLHFEVQPIDGVIEIVRNSSNFVHHDSGNHAGIYIGKPEFMKRYLAFQTNFPAFEMGMFFLMFLVHMLLFLMLHSYPANLYFSLLCLVWCLRTGVVGVKVISSWFPNLSWYTLFRTEYFAAPAAAILVLSIIRELFPKLLPKWFTKVFMILFAAYAVFCLFSPTLLLSYTMFGFIAAFILVAIVILIRLFVKLPNMVRSKELQLEHWITLAGLSVFIVAVVHDGLYYKAAHILNIRYTINGLALMILIFFQMIAMFYATMQQIEIVKESEQKSRLEAETLRQANKMKEEFLGNLSHELQAPLTVVSGFAQITDKMLNNEEPDVDKLHDNLRRVMEEADRMGSLVAQLLDVTAIDSGTFQMHMEQIDIEYLIRQVETGYFPILDDGSNRLLVNVHNELPTIWGDRERLLQVLVNLISNAVRHTKNGIITLDASIEYEDLIIYIKDTGTGIVPELLPHLFSRFPEHRAGEGTGLGLYICKQIIDAHGGKIDVKSEVNVGTVISLNIPKKNARRHE